MSLMKLISGEDDPCSETQVCEYILEGIPLLLNKSFISASVWAVYAD
jgi:hypothetical protein